MKNIKKIAVLGAAIGAMAALAVPSMASAAVWGPLNTNQTLSTSFIKYDTPVPVDIDWGCVHSLGVHVRTPASSTLDVTSASWTGCLTSSSGPYAGCSISMAPTGLPWTAVSTVGGVSVTEHTQVTLFGSGCGSTTFDVSGTLTGGVWNAAAHKVTFTNATGLTMSSGGSFLANVTTTGALLNASQTLTLT